MAAVAAMFLTSIGCSNSDNLSSGSGSGGGESKGGSMARFAVVGDWMYTVNQSKLTVVSLTDPAHPIYARSETVGSNIETIFPSDDKLFIGSQQGMYIYDISSPEFPEHISHTWHFRSCDPVVSHGNLAYVTLNSSLGAWCGKSGDVLQIYDISNIKDPRLINQLNLSSPRGLAIDGDAGLLFVCDGGIIAIDVSEPTFARKVYSSINTDGVNRIDAYDCMILRNEGSAPRLMVIGADGLYQLGYDSEKFTLISKIDLRRDE